MTKNITMNDRSYLETQTETVKGNLFGQDAEVPCLLVAHARENTVPGDRFEMSTSFTIGRGSDCDLTLLDRKVSKRHAYVSGKRRSFSIEDLQSHNGTFVNGIRVNGTQQLADGDVIRIGQTIFVFHLDNGLLLETTAKKTYGLAGNFHILPLLRQAEGATLTGQHLLLAGPSGSGKELLAGALAAILRGSKESFPFVAHNGARFTSEEEATSTLFGVAKRVFSNVDARQGLIEQARGGVLFLDEVHNLPERVQRTLLRVLEDGWYSRIGETTQRQAEVRFIMASNAAPPSYSLAHDLLARLHLVRVPPLRERVADIPCIFDHLLEKTFSRHDLDMGPLKSVLEADHYEAMCLDGFPRDNVRGVADVVNRLSIGMAQGETPVKCVQTVFKERFQDGPVAARHGGPVAARHGGPVAARYSGGQVSPAAPPSPQRAEGDNRVPSPYEQNKDLIIETIHQCNGNVSAAEKILREQGVPCSYHWLKVFLDKWGVPRRKRER